MKRKIRAMALVLCMAMVLSVLSACGNRTVDKMDGEPTKLPVRNPSHGPTDQVRPGNNDPGDKKAVKDPPPDDKTGCPDGDFTPYDLSAHLLSQVPPLEIMKGPGPYDMDKWSSYDDWSAAYDIYHQWLRTFRYGNDDPDTAGDQPVTLDYISDGYLKFAADTTPYVFRADMEPGSNAAYSPLSMYAALCMLSGCAAGDTQSEILQFCNLLPTDPADATRALYAIYHGLSFLDGDAALTLANSIWLNEAMLENGMLNQDTLDMLNWSYYAGTYKAMFGSENAENAVAGWTRNETNGLISAYPNATPDTVSILMNALYFKDAWTDEFDAGLTSEGTFTNANGAVETTDMMHRTCNGNYIRTERYTLASLSSLHGEVRFFLPNEGIDPADLIRDSNIVSSLCVPSSLSQQDGTTYGEIAWTVPKFDTSSDLDLTDAMRQAGLTALNGDYSALSEQLDLYVSKIRQLTHIRADEQGFEAAAVTMIMMDNAAAMPQDLPHIDMTLDRPFGFVIMSEGIPLFIGIVNTTVP